MKPSISLFLLIVSTTNFVQASTPDSQFCDSVLSLGHENYSNHIDTELFQSFQNAVCYSKETFNYATESNQLGGAVNLFNLIGVEGSGQGHESDTDSLYIQFCRESNFENINKFMFRSDSKRVSSAMTKAWESCKSNHLASWQNKYGTVIGVKQQPDYKEFTVTVDARIAQGDIKLNSISPSSVECFDENKLINNFPYVTKDKNSFTLNCKKQADHTIVFSLSTNAGPSNSVDIMGQAPIYLDLQKEIYKLESKYNELNKTLELTIAKRILLKDCHYPETKLGKDYDMHGQSRDKLWNNMDGARWHEVTCPDGYVMVGRESTHHNNTEDRASRYKCCSVTLE